MNELSRDPIKNQVNKDPDVLASASRWMVPTAVGGILLAKLVENIFSQEVQNLINNFIFAWIVVGFGYAALLLWRVWPD